MHAAPLEQETVSRELRSNLGSFCFLNGFSASAALLLYSKYGQRVWNVTGSSVALLIYSAPLPPALTASDGVLTLIAVSHELLSPVAHK